MPPKTTRLLLPQDANRLYRIPRTTTTSPPVLHDPVPGGGRPVNLLAIQCPPRQAVLAFSVTSPTRLPRRPLSFAAKLISEIQALGWKTRIKMALKPHLRLARSSVALPIL